ncbi:hypothetical protein FNV43_RR13055 [Rhamnella rubrinervis]|uniref:Uncharacterized protein n=1 Tax=Rhamnella rubrinervis TaxID=2594499 RepID=A0A8K0H0I0_9ROSA|nr:hypothetical protein FNV43_RR13055 [Rhamnella rubrinervis]
MKKLYKKKGQVHPSLPSIADQLTLLPAAILTLTVTLSPEDKEVLAYLISNNSGDFSGYTKHIHKNNKTAGENDAGEFSRAVKDDHPPVFHCDCFRCYKSFWARWDASENRQLIHEIIEGYEEELDKKKKRSSKRKKGRRKRLVQEEEEETEDMGSVNGLEGDEKGGDETVSLEGCVGGGCDEDGGVEVDEVGIEKGSMRRLVSFIGEKIWGVWNRG